MTPSGAGAIEPGPRTPVTIAGVAALAVVVLIVFGALALVWGAAAEAGGGFTASDWRALRFTALQAALSAILSTALAAPLARALSRRRFAGRETMTALLGAPFLLPVVVAILGIVAVWGRSGWINAALGGGVLDIYGLAGILIAHVFFNLPLAARMFLDAYAAIPSERWRLAAQLGLSGWTLFRLLDGPALRAALPGALALVFSVCATSFAVVLFLGGGPRATTLELAIYEATAYSFDLDRAARLAALQFGLCAVASLAAFALAAPVAAAPGAGGRALRWDGKSRPARLTDGLLLGLTVLFLGAPLVAVALRGAPGLAEMPLASVLDAALRSLLTALGATVLALALAAPIAALSAALEPRRPALARLVDLISLAPLAASPFVLGVAAVIALRPLASVAELALPLTALANALAAMPFAARLLAPTLRAAHAEHGRLADSLALVGWTRFRAVYLARVAPSLGLAAGLVAALSAGDLGVIALFAAPDAPTLPLLMEQLAGGRRIDAAYGAALCLVALALGLFVLFDQLGRRGAARIGVRR